MQNAEEQIRNGEKPEIPKELNPYFTIEQVRPNGWTVAYNYDKWQQDIDLKGFYSIATSKDLDAAEMNRTYFLRDASEKQFVIMKTQLGFDTTRVHKDASIESKYAVCFAASILRSELMNAAKRCGVDTNCMIAKLNRMRLTLMVDGFYRFVDTVSKKEEDFLNEIGIKKEYLQAFATDVNRRINNPINSQVHRLPDDIESPGQKKGEAVRQKKNRNLLGMTNQQENQAGQKEVRIKKLWQKKLC